MGEAHRSARLTHSQTLKGRYLQAMGAAHRQRQVPENQALKGRNNIHIVSSTKNRYTFIKHEMKFPRSTFQVNELQLSI